MKYRTSTFSSYWLSISKSVMIDWFHQIPTFFERLCLRARAKRWRTVREKALKSILKDIVRVYSNKRGWQAYTTFTSCQNAAYSNKFFSPLGRYMLWKVLHFHQANVILAACFTLRRHDTHIDLLLLLFLVGRICPLIQAHFL